MTETEEERKALVRKMLEESKNAVPPVGPKKGDKSLQYDGPSGMGATGLD